MNTETKSMAKKESVLDKAKRKQVEAIFARTKRLAFEKELMACIKNATEGYPFTVMYKKVPKVNADGNEVYTVLVGATESSAGYEPTEVDESIFPDNCEVQYASYGKEIEGVSNEDVWVVPSGTKQISPCAFHGAKIKGRIIVTGTVEEIGSTAFAECEGITEVEIRSSVKTIGIEAFCGSGVSKVMFPDTLEYICQYAFQYTALHRVKIPQSIVCIEDGAFAECLGLTSIYVPISYVKRINSQEKGTFETATQKMQWGIGLLEDETSPVRNDVRVKYY